jgi:predicted nucleotidyltransferase component of viral defense system
MITPKPADAKHKVQLMRLLTALVDNPYISRMSHFKGGTCAAMLGYLDRFSVDLDFDIEKQADVHRVEKNITSIIVRLGLDVKNKSSKTLFYTLKYTAGDGERNTLKLSFMGEDMEGNVYEKKYIPEIDRFVSCQTIETMLANKLIALTNRYKKNNNIAIRDVYDIHYFFEQGYKYDSKIITLRTGKAAKEYFKEVVQFIEEKISEKDITNDLSFLLEYNHFQALRKTLKQETITLVKDEIKRLQKV